MEIKQSKIVLAMDDLKPDKKARLLEIFGEYVRQDPAQFLGADKQPRYSQLLARFVDDLLSSEAVSNINAVKTVAEAFADRMGVQIERNFIQIVERLNNAIYMMAYHNNVGVLKQELDLLHLAKYILNPTEAVKINDILVDPLPGGKDVYNLIGISPDLATKVAEITRTGIEKPRH